MAEQERQVSIALPLKYWLVILRALNSQWIASEAALAKMKEKDFTQEGINNLSRDTKAQMEDEMIVQTMILDALVDQDILSPEVKTIKGIEAFLRIIKGPGGEQKEP